VRVSGRSTPSNLARLYKIVYINFLSFFQKTVNTFYFQQTKMHKIVHARLTGCLCPRCHPDRSSSSHLTSKMGCSWSVDHFPNFLFQFATGALPISPCSLSFSLSPHHFCVALRRRRKKKMNSYLMGRA
jgi:hypothetical protein